MIQRATACLLMLAIAGGCEKQSQAPGFTAVVYTETFDQGMTDIATGDFYQPAVSHPPIRVDPQKYTNVLTFQMGPMMPPLRKAAPSSGPLILFSDDLEVLVFSPMNHFFISLISYEDGLIDYGVAGEVQELPAGFSHRFLLVEGRGINATVEHWGELLRADRQRERIDRYADTGLSYMGYWTDNGAYYYYQTEPGLNEEDSMLAVRDDAVANDIPFGYLQLDSWWYFKAPGSGFSPHGGLTLWEPQPEMFPEGLGAFQQKLGLPLITHNRWFAEENHYLDSYDFVLGEEEPRMALPLERGVFDEFMENAASWKVFTYEQDWLMNQFWGVAWLRNAVGHAGSWMGNMHDAAQDQGLTMQICMAGAMHLLDALDRPGITTMRTSIDYNHEISKALFWPQFHTVNLIAWAVGVLPFKDNFHSSEDQGEAEALISVLSAGMVGPGDQIGAFDAELLRRTCRSDGLLLKPDRPATPIDAMFLPHQRPYLTRSWSTREDGRSWTYLAAYRISGGTAALEPFDQAFSAINYDHPLEDMFVFPERIRVWTVDLEADLGIQDEMVVYNWRTGEAELTERFFEIPRIEQEYDFAYFILAPVYKNGLALIGEMDKFVTLADRRFTGISAAGGELTVDLEGVPGEVVKLLAYDTRAGRLLDPIEATIGDDGRAQATLTRD